MAIARLANHRNPHVAILALTLLDTLVQSCGYPFHLQISTKEFLNELVRRFPERPPPFPWPVMWRILDLIHGWKQTICAESRWKEDLGNIRDMHRLLMLKGYRFRELPGRQNNAIEAATSNLKSAEELEEEDRVAQSAKLQELIRRGTPRDLAAAQELMKALAGADPDAKPDYRTQALTELNKLQQKVILLNEMLDNVDTERGEKFASGDAYDQVSAILASARPKLQKWISDAREEDAESLDTFLQINDQINSTFNRYEAFKKGDYAAAANPIPAEVSNAASTVRVNDSLIDFSDAPSFLGTAGPTNTKNDLSSLFAAPVALTTRETSTSVALPGFQPVQTQIPSPVPERHLRGLDLLHDMLGNKPRPQSAISSPSISSTPPAAIQLPGTPTPTCGGTIEMVQPHIAPTAKPTPVPAGGTSLEQGKDPFAELAGLF